MSTAGYEIAVQPRNEFGNNAARRIRKEGLIPAVVYAKGKEAEAVTVKANEWEVLSQHDLNLVYLIDGDKRKAALVKEVQFNYMKNCVVHIDFQEVDMNAEVHAEVAIHPAGEAKGAAHGGVFEQELHMLNVACKAADLPETISIDVSALEIGEAMHVKDLALPAGVRALNDPEEIVFHVMQPRQEEEAPAEAEGEPEVTTAKAPKAE